MSEITFDIIEQTIDCEFNEEIIEVSVEGSVSIVESEFSIQAIAGEAVGGHKPIWLDGMLARVASADNPDCYSKVVGISRHAASQGDTVNIQFAGELSGFPTMNLGKKYLGEAGTLIDAPHSMVCMALGKATASNKLLINLEYAIRRL